MPIRRGRPPKFGRPARLIALTLPDDVLAWLETIHADPGWAIVSLAERYRDGRGTAVSGPPSDAELVSIGGRRELIVVSQKAFGTLRGVAMVSIGGGRAFLALEPGQGLADLELAVLDRLEEPGVSATERRSLVEFRRLLRTWRQDPAASFTTRSIVVAERDRKRRAG